MSHSSIYDDLCNERESGNLSPDDLEELAGKRMVDAMPPSMGVVDEDLLDVVASGIREDLRRRGQEAFMEGEKGTVFSFLDEGKFKEWIAETMRTREEPSIRLSENGGSDQKKRRETKRRPVHEQLDHRIALDGDSSFVLPPLEALPEPGAVAARWEMQGDQILGTDSVGRNHLENHGVSAAQGQAGMWAADFEKDEGDFFTIADSAQEGLDFTQSFSFSFWFKVEDPQNGTDVRSIVYKYGEIGDWSYALYHIQEGGIREFDLIVNSTGGRGGDGVARLPFTMPAGEWFHALVTHDGGNGGETALHINGVEVARASTGKTSVYDGRSEFRLGSHSTGGAHWDGFMEDVIAWKEALSAEDAEKLYAAYRSVTVSPPPDDPVPPPPDETGGGGGENESLPEALRQKLLLELYPQEEFTGENFRQTEQVNLKSAFTVVFDVVPTQLADSQDPLSFRETDKNLTFVAGVDGGFIYGIGNGQTWGKFISAPSGTLANGRRDRVMGIYDGNQTTLIVNGQSIGTATNGSYSLEGAFNIGVRRTADGNLYPFPGKVPALLVFNAALTPEEQEIVVHASFGEGGDDTGEEEENDEETEDDTDIDVTACEAPTEVKIVQNQLLGSWTPGVLDGSDEGIVRMEDVDWFDGGKEWSIRSIFEVPDTEGQYPIAAKWLTRDGREEVKSRQFAIDVSGGSLHVFMGTGKDTQTVTEAPIEANVTYDLVVNRTKDKVAVFLNGELVAETANSAAPARNTEPFMVGGMTVDGWLQAAMKGRIDTIKVLGRTLTSGEVKTLHCGGTIVPVNEAGEPVEEREKTLIETLPAGRAKLVERDGKYFLQATAPNAWVRIPESGPAFVNGAYVIPGPLTEIRVSVYGKTAAGEERLIHEEYALSEKGMEWYIPEDIVRVTSISFGNVASGVPMPEYGSLGELHTLPSREEQTISAGGYRPWERLQAPSGFTNDDDANAYLQSLDRLRGAFAAGIQNPYFLQEDGESIMAVLKAKNPDLYDIPKEVERRLAGFSGSESERSSQSAYLTRLLSDQFRYVVEEIQKKLKDHNISIRLLMGEASGSIARFPDDPAAARTEFLNRVQEKKIAGLPDPLFHYLSLTPATLFDLAMAHREDILSLDAKFRELRAAGNNIGGEGETDYQRFLKSLSPELRSFFEALGPGARRAFQVAWGGGAYFPGPAEREDLVVGNDLVALVQANYIAAAEWLGSMYDSDPVYAVAIAQREGIQDVLVACECDGGGTVVGGGESLDAPESLTGAFRLFFKQLPTAAQKAFLSVYENGKHYPEGMPSAEELAVGKVLYDNAGNTAALAIGKAYVEHPEEVAAFAEVARQTYVVSNGEYASNGALAPAGPGGGNFTWEGMWGWLESIDEEGEIQQKNLNEERYQAALNGLSVVIGIMNNVSQEEKHAYYVSRPMGLPSLEDRASHNFIVTDASYLGDPNAIVHSYGKTANGRVGRVDENTTEFSDGTYETDLQQWLSLGTDIPHQGVYSLQIPTTSERVRRYAFSIIADQDYSALGGIFGANSNSAAQAIIRASTCSIIPPPDGERISPGNNDADEINFVIPLDCPE